MTDHEMTQEDMQAFTLGMMKAAGDLELTYEQFQVALADMLQGEQDGK